jgi:DNA replication protein DnaC
MTTAIHCRRCNLDLGYPPELAETIREFFPPGEENVYCDPCQEIRRTEADEQKAEERARLAVDASKRFVPGEYAETDTERLGANLRAILGYDFPNGRGVVFYGKSRAGKSRTAFAMVARRIADRTFASAEWVRGSAIARIIEDAYSDEPQEKDGAKKRMRALMRTPCLLIDDLDKVRPSPAVVEFLFDLFCERCNLGLPIVITTQSTGEHLAAILAGKGNGTHPAAIVQRIREFCLPVHAKPDQQSRRPDAGNDLPNKERTD